MIRGWIGTALLTTSLIVGFGYFEPAQPAWWFLYLMLGAIALCWSFSSIVKEGILSDSGDETPGGENAADDLTSSHSRLWMWISVFGGLAAAWVMPLPFRSGPILLALGAGLVLAYYVKGQRRRGIGLGCATAGTILIAESLGLMAYIGHTLRSHELPVPMAWGLSGLMQLTGLEVAYADQSFAIRSAGQLHNLGATWELLFDPATFLFFIGAVVFLGVVILETIPAGIRFKTWGRAIGVIALIYVIWTPIRAVLFVHVYLQRTMLEHPLARANAMDQFVSDWAGAALLIIPVVLLGLLVRRPKVAAVVEESTEDEQPEAKAAQAASTSPKSKSPAVALGCVFLGVILLTVAIQWHPVGSRKDGRVTVVERHSDWEPTTRPYSTDFYGEEGSYNYAAAYDYLSQFYKMSRILESQEITAKSLADTDVLIIKNPTASYDPKEIRAIGGFVDGGGSLLLVGDHTNVDNSSTYLNEIIRGMGFAYRNDLLFHVDSPYRQDYRVPAMPHPAVQNMPPMDFAVSCSIDPGRTIGRPVIWDRGLWNLPSDYNAYNYHPHAFYRPSMRTGAFCQVWGMTYGSGRVLAFTDSTIFSNFCVYQPGKAEHLREMIEWLNRTSPFDRVGLWLVLVVVLVVAGVGLLGRGVWLGRKNATNWISLVAVGLAGWASASSVLEGMQRLAMPVPEVVRPISRVVIDRTVCDGPLSLGAYLVDKSGSGHGLLEQWIPRISYIPREDAPPLNTEKTNAQRNPAQELARYLPGPKYYTTRAKGEDVFDDKVEAVVFINPSLSVPEAFREKLVKFVEEGGRVLVIDSPENETSTANSLLWPFGVSVNLDSPVSGKLMLDDTGPGFEVEQSRTVWAEEGLPVAVVGDWPVGVKKSFGKGSVTVIGFGNQFNDSRMGWTWLMLPEDADERQDQLLRYDTLYTILWRTLNDQPPGGMQEERQPLQGNPSNESEIDGE